MAVLSKDEKIRLMAEAPVGQAIIALVLPTILSQLVTMIYNMADTFFVGRIGDMYQTAALSVVFPFSMLLVIFANLFGIGGNVTIAKALGQSDYEKVKKVSAFSLYASIAADLLLSIIFLLSVDAIISFLGASGQTSEYAKQYLFYVLILGAVPTGTQLTLAHMLRSEGASKQAGTGMLIGGILNTILDPVFILVLGNGVVGAAIATLISNTVSLIYFIVNINRNKAASFLSFAPKDFSFRYGAEIVKNGLQAAFTTFCGTVSNFVMAKTAALFSDVAISSFGIMQKYTTMAMNIAMGFGQGVMPLLGFNFAARNFNRIKDINKTAFKFEIIFVTVMIVIVELFSNVCASIFTTHPQTITAAARFIRLGFFGTFGTVIMNYMMSSFQAFGKWKTGMAAQFVRVFLLYVPMILLFGKFFGVDGLALAWPGSEFGGLILYTILYIKTLKQLELESR